MNAITGGTIMTASHQWASRPNDERFTSLTEMSAMAHSVHDNALAKVLSSRKILARPVAEDRQALVLETPDGISTPSHWAFGQLCERAGAPASYMRKLPSELAADCINYGMVSRDAMDTGLLVHDAEAQLPGTAAVTGPNYGRIWNHQVIDALIKRFGDGVTGRFKVPGEFGHDVPITKANTTLYASDRDMFVFLADETNRIEIPDRRPGLTGSLARGIFVWNSEVGAATLGMATFLFDYVCCNRIVWGAKDYKEVRLRHTSAAPDRWVEEAMPAIQAYADASALNIVQAIEHAKAARIDEVDDFLQKRRFTQTQAKAISLAHLAEEQRPIETVWDAVTGITAYAKGMLHQDERVAIERQAGDLLSLVA